MSDAQKHPAFSFLELILSIGILVLLLGAAAPPLVGMFFSNQGKLADEELVHTLRHARERAAGQIADNSWGVYLDTGAETYTMFAGTSYAARVTVWDRVVTLPPSVEFGTVSLIGGGTEILFAQITGETTQTGTVQLISDEGTTTLTIYSFGNVISN